MITVIAGWLAPVVGQKFARAAAWAALVIIAIPLFFGLKACYDGSVVDKWVNGANVELLEKKDEVAGEADKASDDRKAEHDKRVKTTGDLVDEAVKNGCAVGEYLASDGANCVQS